MKRLPSTDDREAHQSSSRIVRFCAKLADATSFNTAMLLVILANAVVLGVETYDHLEDEYYTTLHTLNDLFLGVFIIELGIRLIAHGKKPLQFFRSGWNIFDLFVVIGAFIPGVRENATLLRLMRLARIIRVIRLLPDLRIFTIAIARSLPGVLSLAIMALTLMYLYGMVGWLLFGDKLPQHYGTIGEAMLTTFVLLSLENFPTYLEEAMKVSAWAVPYFVSYVLIASFLLLNIFIGVVINSMDEARAIEAMRDLEERAEHGELIETKTLEQRVTQLQQALDELAQEVKRRRL